MAGPYGQGDGIQSSEGCCFSRKKPGSPHSTEGASGPQPAGLGPGSLLVVLHRNGRAGWACSEMESWTQCRFLLNLRQDANGPGGRGEHPPWKPPHSPPYTSEVEARSRRAPTRFASPTGGRDMIRETVSFRETKKTHVHMHILGANLSMLGDNGI